MKADDASRSDTTINSIIKLASSLQKALDRGRSNHLEMNEVSRYINNIIKTNVNESLRYIDTILENGKGRSIKRLRNDLLALFNMLLASNASYEHMLKSNGKIDRERLAMVFELDNDMIDSLKRLRDMLHALEKERAISDETEKEIRKLAANIEKCIIKKRDLLGSGSCNLSPTN